MIRLRFAPTFLIIILSSCNTLPSIVANTSTSPVTVNPSATPTITYTPSNTTIPFIDLEGLLFFDYNGSGLQEEEEPPIVGFGVCTVLSSGQLCVPTDANGRFVFPKAAPYGKSISLTFIDPNAQNPIHAFRYIDLWKSSIVVQAYEINGSKVPEQHLNDTEVIPLEKGISLMVGKQNTLGLTQGFLTFPFKCEEKYQLGAQYDHDPRQGNILLWNGETKSSGYDPLSGHNWSSDNHDGTDFIAAEGTAILATATGEVNFADEISGSLHVTLDHFGGLFQTGSGHMSQIVVSFGDKVYRGQIIGFVGHSGTSGNHLHF